jgi:hypothetical protein
VKTGIFTDDKYMTAVSKFVDWRQGAAVMQREAITVIPSCSGGGNVVVA